MTTDWNSLSSLATLKESSVPSTRIIFDELNWLETIIIGVDASSIIHIEELLLRNALVEWPVRHVFEFGPTCSETIWIQVMDKGYPTATHQVGKADLSLGFTLEWSHSLISFVVSIIPIAIEVVEDKGNVLLVLDSKVPRLTSRLRVEAVAVR